MGPFSGKVSYEYDTKNMSNYAIALDIGTTNISGALVDVDKKRVLSTVDRPNEQLIYGDDVISRLKIAGTKEGARELNKKLIHSIDSAMGLLVTQAKLDKNKIAKILAVGNAVMYHLTFLFPINTLAHAPFLPFETKLIKEKAEDIGLKDFSKAEFIFLPNVGGFVGSDAIGVILATEMHKKKSLRLAIDLGTNGEVILGNSKNILVTSTAAGPAFEGWHISCGMKPSPGAIISFKRKKNKTILKTIGDYPPVGIASSGLIEIISVLIKEGYIDKTGRLKGEEFKVYNNGNRSIYISQRDVREIQLAKSAIHTAINVLTANYNMRNIEEVIVTGKFGGSLNKEDLARIGIIPPTLKAKKFNFIENLALKGASLILIEDRLEELDSILQITKHIELHKERSFQEEFAKGLHF